MPSKGKKGKAAEQREQTRKEHTKREIEQPSNLSGRKSSQNIQRTADWKVVSGTVHQGNTRFQYPGIQCTYISFWALIYMKIKSPISWNGNDID